MPTGTFLTKVQKEQIHDYFCNHKYSIEKAHQDLFQGDNDKISVRTLENHKRKLLNEEIKEWIEGKPRTGNKKSELDDPDVSAYLDSLACKRPKVMQDEIASNLRIAIGDAKTRHQSTISRWLHRHKIADHRISYISAHLNEEERAQTLARAAPYKSHYLHNFDESSCARDKFIAKFACQKSSGSNSY